MSIAQVNSVQDPGAVETPPGKSLFSRWTSYLLEPIDGASLAVFRMCFGVCVLVNTWVYSADIYKDYLFPRYFFPYVQGLRPWPGEGMYIHFAIMSFAAACIGLGFGYRLATLVFGVCFTYTFLLEQTYFQNHLYLICLFSLLFFVMPLHREWSIDNANGTMPRTIPRWCLFTLKAQIAIVYFYGAVAKLNYDWCVRMQPMSTYVRQFSEGNAFLAPIMSQHWFAQLMSYAGIAVDFTVPFLLWCRPTFWLGAAISLMFHLANSRLFHIGIFPWMMIGTIGLFAPPDWPRAVLRKLNPVISPIHKFIGFMRPGQSAAAHPDSAEKAGTTAATQSNISIGGPDTRLAKTPSPEKANKKLSAFSIAALVFIHVYLIIQILVPLRRFQFNGGENNWTEYAHQFSWQMMLSEKTATLFTVQILDPKTKAELPVDLNRLLNGTQAKHMSTRPEVIWLFAQMLAADTERKTGVRPIVRVKAIESLNLRPPQDFVDSSVDLAKEPAKFPATWIVPLKPFE